MPPYNLYKHDYFYVVMILSYCISVLILLIHFLYIFFIILMLLFLIAYFLYFWHFKSFIWKAKKKKKNRIQSQINACHRVGFHTYLCWMNHESWIHEERSWSVVWWYHMTLIKSSLCFTVILQLLISATNRHFIVMHPAHSCPWNSLTHRMKTVSISLPLGRWHSPSFCLVTVFEIPVATVNNNDKLGASNGHAENRKLPEHF